MQHLEGTFCILKIESIATIKQKKRTVSLHLSRRLNLSYLFQGYKLSAVDNMKWLDDLLSMDSLRCSNHHLWVHPTYPLGNSNIYHTYPSLFYKK